MIKYALNGVMLLLLWNILVLSTFVMCLPVVHICAMDCYFQILYSVNREILAFLLQKRVVLFWCVQFWPFSFLVCLILATFGSHVFNFFVS